MKGIIFTGFLEMVESRFGIEMVDTMIENTAIPVDGHYTAIGTYDPRQMIALVNSLSTASGIPTEELLSAYGEYIFGVFVSEYAHFFEQKKDSFSFLETVESYIHPEVLKLYPKAELPSFEISRDENIMKMIYRSPRSMGHFAKGVIKGCMAYFEEKAYIEMRNIDRDGTVVEFIISR